MGVDENIVVKFGKTKINFQNYIRNCGVNQTP